MSSRASNALVGLFPSAFALIRIADARVATGGAAAAGVKVTHDRGEHAFEHLRRQPPGIGVVATAMITVEKLYTSIQRMAAAVRKRIVATGKAERAQCRVMSDPAQSENRRAVGHRGELGGKVRIAVSDFFRQRLVAGRKTFDGIGDPGADPPQPRR